MHSPVDGHLGCYSLSALANSAAVKIPGQVFLELAFNSLGSVPRSGIAGSYGKSIFSF